MGNGGYRRAALSAAMIACAGVVMLGAISDARAQDAAPAPAVKAKKAKAAKAGPAAPGADAAAPVAKDPAAAGRNYETGVAAYQAGKYAAAVASITAAIEGGLASNLMAKALYYRGAAFQQQKMPGQAISDLTSALWLRGGLDEAERVKAAGFRSAAYRDAGLEEPAVSASERSASNVVSAPVTTGSTSSGQSTTTVVPAPAGGGFFGDLFSGGSAAKPAVAAAPPSASASAGLFGGLPDLFGGTPPAKAAPPIETGSPPQAAQQTARIEPANGPDEELPWAKKPVTETAAAVPVEPAGVSAAPAPVKAAGKGKYRIQVAAVPSRDEASAVIANLQSKGGVLAAMPATVDEAKFGASTFYRVRLGPYASAADTKAPCEALKANGLDCLVTAK